MIIYLLILITVLLRNKLIKIVECQIENRNDFVNVSNSHIAFVSKDYFIVKIKDGYLKITNWICPIKLEVGDKIG